MNNLVKHLRDMAAIGKANALRRADIAKALDVSIRDVREMAEAARLKGEFVCYSTASNGGLYLPMNDAEKMGQIERLRSECRRRLRQYSALLRSLVDRHQGKLFPKSVDDVFSKKA